MDMTNNIELYTLSELNKHDVTVLYATPELYTEMGRGCVIGEYVKAKGLEAEHCVTGDILKEMCSSYYIMGNKRISPLIFQNNQRFVYFCQIFNTEEGVRCLKTLTCETVDDLIKGVGFDVFALYVNRSNLNFIGYQNRNDKHISSGCIRMLRDAFSELTDIELCDRVNTTKSGLTNIYSKLSLSLINYIQTAKR